MAEEQSKVETVEHYEGDKHDPTNDPTNHIYNRRIIIPMDGSDNSKRAFEVYMDKFRHSDDFVVFIHIHQPPTLSGISLAAAPALYMSEEYRNSVEQSVIKCNHYGKQLKQLAIDKNIKFKVVLATVQSRGCGETILHIAQEYNPTLIVIGSRGLGTISRLMLGSTSDYLVHHSAIPVCVVPPLPSNQ